MIYKSLLKQSLILVVFATLLSISTQAQQDPQYTHYMYNTMSVNPGYAGQRDVLSATALYRNQWVGVDGAPKTLTFGIHGPLRNERLGLGLNVISDQLGPSKETSIDVNFSYTIPIGLVDDVKLSFGLKGGLHTLDTDWSKGRYENPDNAFNQNVNLLSPILGSGLYLHSETWYLGLAVPNILATKHYNDFQESLATERLHYYFIGGYVFDVSDDIKFKPAFLVKAVSGAPLIADVSLNALFNEKFTLGVAYRWDDSVSGLVGLQISEGLQIGYSYDLTTSNFNNYNSGTHELMLRFELFGRRTQLSPRFF